MYSLEPNVTVVMNHENDANDPSESHTREFIHFHISVVSKYAWELARDEKQKKKGIYFIRQIQRMFDQYHKNE